MTPYTIRTVRIDDIDWTALRVIEEREGVLVSEQVRRAVKMWLESKGVRPVDFDTTAYDPKLKRAARKKPKSRRAKP